MANAELIQFLSGKKFDQQFIKRCTIMTLSWQNLCSIYTKDYVENSMTSLFAHKVAQPTKWRFLPKNLSQLVIFVIGLAFTWV